MNDINESQLPYTVVSIIARLAGTTPDQISMQDRFVGDLGFDSLKSMETLARIMDEFNINPNIEAVMALQTVGEVIEYLIDYISTEEAGTESSMAC